MASVGKRLQDGNTRIATGASECSTYLDDLIGVKEGDGERERESKTRDTKETSSPFVKGLKILCHHD